MDKGQVWITDFMVAIVLFIVMIGVYFIAAKNITTLSRTNVDVLYAEASGLSELLLASEGVNSSITLLNEKRMVSPDRVYEVSTLSYDELKVKGNVKHEFLVSFNNGTDEIALGNITLIGKPGVNLTTLAEENPETLVALKRFAVSEGRIIEILVEVWE